MWSLYAAADHVPDYNALYSRIMVGADSTVFVSYAYFVIDRSYKTYKVIKVIKYRGQVGMVFDTGQSHRNV